MALGVSKQITLKSKESQRLNLAYEGTDYTYIIKNSCHDTAHFVTHNLTDGFAGYFDMVTVLMRSLMGPLTLNGD